MWGMTVDEKRARLLERKGAWNASNRAKIRESIRDGRHGLKPGEYAVRFAAQGGLCAICHKPETVRRGLDNHVQALSVDHCHASGVNGELLCHACNTGLGRFADDPVLLEAAAAYVRRTRPRYLGAAS